MAIGKRLKYLRKSHKFTQATMAQEINSRLPAEQEVATGTYRNWEQGINEPSHEILKIIVGILGTTSDYLYGLTDVETNNNVDSLSIIKKELINRILLSDEQTLTTFIKMLDIIENK